MSSDNLEMLERKERLSLRGVLTGYGAVAMVDSLVTVIDCLDSQVYQFKLVKNVDAGEPCHSELPIDSAVGLALLGSRAGDYVNLSLGGEEGGLVVLCVNNNNNRI